MRSLAVLVVVVLVAASLWTESAVAAEWCDSGDSAALVTFKAGFEDREGLFITWESGTDCCSSWSGVTCNEAGRVTGLELNGPDPSVGTIEYSTTYQPGVKRKPSTTTTTTVGESLSSLTALEEITFLNIFFNSEIPPSWIQLSSLRILQLDTCNITGTIPAAINQLKNLETLHITPGWYHEIALTGSLPLEVCELTKLIFLGFEGNDLTGPLPYCLDRFKVLKYLNLEGNRLSGSLPWSIGLMPALLDLNLADNEISGYIPSSIGSLSNITYLNLENNQLQGSLPSTFSLLSTLLRCKLGYNQITGKLPSDLGNWTQIEVLQLRNNRFYGEVPPSVGMMTSLTALELDYNNFWGSIPRELAMIKGGRITLSSNRLSGSIPPELLNNEPFHASLHLDVSRNFLSGPVPTSIGNVWAFLASNNQLSGGFPLQLARINTVDLSYNKLDQIGRMGKKLEVNYSNPLYPQADSIRELHLNNNQFSGSFPAWLLELDSLRLLDISQNEFAGPLPDALFDFPTLWTLNVSGNSFDSQLPLNPYRNVKSNEVIQMLDLHDNQFSGSVPVSFLKALARHGIMGLDLSENEFSGPLDEAIGLTGGVNVVDDPWTYHLDLSHNKFSGPIPSTIGQLKNLKYLDLSHNKFSGVVPAAISQLNDLVYLDLSENSQLTGIGDKQRGQTSREF